MHGERGGGDRYEALRADAVHTQEKFDGTVTLGGDAAAPLNITAKFRGKGSLECQRKSLTVSETFTPTVSLWGGREWTIPRVKTVEESLPVRSISSLLHA